MGLHVLLDQVGPVNLGIDLGSRKAGVTHQLLDRAQVGAGTEEMGGETVAQGVRGGVARESEGAAQPGDQELNDPGGSKRRPSRR